MSNIIVNWSKMKTDITIREILSVEFEELGRLLVDVYSKLDGFPGKDEQPGYYKMLANIGLFTEKKETKVLVALSAENKLMGGVVYFGDMAQYGSGGTAVNIKNASGIRLLGVSPESRGMGAGKALTNACIQLAKDKKQSQVILHSTRAMETAWKLYEKIGFKRSEDLDFKQKELSVFGFRLDIETQ